MKRGSITPENERFLTAFEMTRFLSSRSEARDLVTLFGMYFHSNPAKPEPKFHRMEDMSALRAKTEAGWVLAGAHWFSRDFCFSDT
uniref:Uncharacterized protein n=1 Tax=Candidatus Kentrum sp. LFY TaxID=2126342 RepID=A0A450UPF7_9GAMM|nr:MAG: hypothetical protein BECKLFY1418B_GA0070995_10582 [Candidatus Kentron sp. LFY]